MPIVWTDSAQQDLHHIEASIRQDRPQVAIRVVLQVLAKTETQLEVFPALGKAGRLSGTRELGISGLPYVIIYKTVNEAVHILRVLHAAQKWP